MDSGTIVQAKFHFLSTEPSILRVDSLWVSLIQSCYAIQFIHHYSSQICPTKSLHIAAKLVNRSRRTAGSSSCSPKSIAWLSRISSPGCNTTASVPILLFGNFSLRGLITLSTSSRSYFSITIFFVANPLTSLSPSCADIHALAHKFCAISSPPGKPVQTFPPMYQALLTRSKQCSRAVRGRAASLTR